MILTAISILVEKLPTPHPYPPKYPLPQFRFPQDQVYFPQDGSLGTILDVFPTEQN